VGRRTAVINQLRGLLMERGITVRKGRSYIEDALPGILEDADSKLSAALRMLLSQAYSEMRQLQSQIDEADAVIRRMAREDEACQRLVEVPGVGPVIATAMIAAIGNGAAFKKGRGFAA
jgi:transposase